MLIGIEMLVQGGEGKPACDDEDYGDYESPKMKHEAVSFRKRYLLVTRFGCRGFRVLVKGRV
jgi:hypothetical protein